MKLSPLQIRHLAVTTLERYARIAYEHEIKFFRAVSGQKVFSVNGGLLKKHEHAPAPELDPNKTDSGRAYGIDYTITRMCWIEERFSNVWLHVKVSVQGGDLKRKGNQTEMIYFCEYEQRAFLIGENRGGIFTVTDRSEPFHPVPSLDDLAKLTEQLKHLERQYEKAFDAIDHRFHKVLNIQRLTHH